MNNTDGEIRDNREENTEPAGVVRVSVRNLVEFILRSGDIDNRRKGSADADNMLEGARVHRLIQSRMGTDYHAEVLLRETRTVDINPEILPPDTSPYINIVIEGRADGIIYKEDDLLNGNYSVNHYVNQITNEVKPDDTVAYPADPVSESSAVTIDEIKTTYRDVDKMSAPDPVHLAQAKCYACFFAGQYRLPCITVRMTYVNRVDQKIRFFHERYTYKEIQNWFDDLFSAYKKWAVFEFEWLHTRNEAIKHTEFPFEYRDGQKELMSQVYRTIYHRRKLFLEAPTGVGKTISTVFPSVKALGEGLSNKIFYLTAKTITRTVARECFDILRDNGLKFKTVIITAKEKTCPLETSDCNPTVCPYAKGHFDRINDAIYDLLTHNDDFCRERIEEYALKHQVCPYELSLDIALFSDAVICDYNYVFDPNVYLRRFFSDTSVAEYIFLVDEAHNLAERAMDMYSAELYREDVLHIKNLLKQVDIKSERALESVNKKLQILKKQILTATLTEEAAPGDDRGRPVRTVKTPDFRVFDDITDAVLSINRAIARLDELLDEVERFEGRDEVLEFYFELRHFINMFDCMGEDDYVIYAELKENSRRSARKELMLKLLCTNPSENLKQRLIKARSTVFFSATLLPVQYYKDMLSGDPEDYAVYASSVFDQRKRGLFIANDVSSRYTRRNETEYLRIAGYIADITAQNPGNYMVFFPSHAFLNSVYELYEENFADIRTIVLKQKNVMSETEREEFLDTFYRNEHDEVRRTLIGFCVMGGIFSEGIDMKNDSLIGAIIVGTGLPMVCNEREIMKSSYDRAGLNGFDYAYRFPGMNKVLQAGGRVIRTIDDVGIVALLDERFLAVSYKKLFPREWRDYRVCSADSVSAGVRSFWNNHK
ncbi:MAG: ATP-dependent DNA helicase [Lachnospiraceae bacterium]|nr:ATP-dependent DNA helicase [Lachnospiraceae bacterium]